MRTPIAIVGIGCRFSGGIRDSSTFFGALQRGSDALGDTPKDRFDAEALVAAGKIPSSRGGFLENIDRFDAEFFGISPREALTLDPSQRQILEVSYEALENAGGWKSVGVETGVFLGSMAQLTQRAALEGEDMFSILGVAPDAAAGRMSFAFEFSGPSLSVGSDRSSSLQAVWLACQSLDREECSAAVVASANLILEPRVTLALARGGFLSPDGRCKFADARANGIVRSEGVAALVLMPQSRAIAERRRIYAVVRGGATNHGARTSGDLMRPSEEAQVKLLERALKDSNLNPSDITYVEAHGTGTSIGDQVELQAIANVLGGQRDGRLRVGSVKTNLGHTEATAGLAGLIKVALSLHHGRIPPSLHFETPNPNVDFASAGIEVPTACVPWTAPVRRAGVSAFGLSGSNVHIILESAPEQPPSPSRETPPITILPVSARTRDSLDRCLELRAQETREGPISQLAAHLAHRDHHPLRRAVVGTTRDELNRSLRELVGEPTIRSLTKPRIAFVCPGHGGQWPGMGKRLFEAEPAFRNTIERAAEAMHPYLDRPLIALITEATPEDFTLFHRAQPAIFAMSLGLAAVWNQWGVQADLVLGTSMGEVAAAHLAGVLSLDDAARVICRRSSIFGRLTGVGGMGVLQAPIDEIEARVAPFRDKLAIGTYQSPSTVVLSGELGPLREILTEATNQGRFAREVKSVAATHSPLADPFHSEILEALGTIRPKTTTLRFVSTTTVRDLTGLECDATYWWHNARDPVRLTQVVDTLLREGPVVFLELGAHPVLWDALTDNLHAHPQYPGAATFSLRRDEDPELRLRKALAELYQFGVDLDWSRLSSAPDDSLELAPYPFTGRSYPRLMAATASTPSPEEPTETTSAQLDVKTLVNRELRRVLHLDLASPLDPDQAFRELGLTSLLNVELRTRLERSLGRTLPSAALFNHPTISRLTQFLESEPQGIVRPTIQANRVQPQAAPSVDTTPEDAIAIVGYACRFPGGANSPEAFFDLLDSGRDPLIPIPASRWNLEAFYSEDRSTPGKMVCREGGFIEGIDLFDAAYFRISPREAPSMDPQQRILLELSVEAFENAGIDPRQVRSRTGVYAGVWSDDYVERAIDATGSDPYAATGTYRSIIAGRVAYALGLEGPTMVVDTACSSSLVAIHLACQALKAAECDLALAGGVNLVLSPTGSVYLSKLGALSPTSRCRAFSDDADGYVRSDGAGLLLLKRLSAARASNDRILGILRATAVNQDGASNGLTAPNGEAQAAMLRQALDHAGLKARDIDYVECHGTGTPLGDPIELQSLATVYGVDRETPLLIGSVKSNIGHTEGASGVAGLLKVLGALQRQRIPGNLHFRAPNPHIPWSTLPLEVVASGRAWAGKRAAVSSFGMSGTNAHAIIESSAQVTTATPESLTLVVLSARDQDALVRIERNLAQYLTAHPELSIVDVASTLARRTQHAEARVAFACTSREQLILALANPRPAPQTLPLAWKIEDTTFLSEDQRTLLRQRSRAFREAFESCASVLGRPIEGRGPEARFTLAYSLLAMLRAWGVVPSHLLASGPEGWIDHPSVTEALTAVARNEHPPSRVPYVGALWCLGAGPEGCFREDEPIEGTLFEAATHFYQQGCLDAGKWLADWGLEGQRVELPTYPFARNSHWLAPKAHETLPEARMTLAGESLPVPGTTRHRHVKLSPFHFPEIFDHQVFGQPILPGVFYLAAVLAMMQEEWGASSGELFDVEFQRPLVLDPEHPVDMHATFLPREGSEVIFELQTSTGLGTWVTHVRGTLVVGDRAFRTDLGTETPEDAREAPVDHYDRLAKLEVAWGPLWRWIRKVTQGAGRTRAELSAPTSSTSGPVPPGMIDNALVAMMGALPWGDDRPLLPFFVERVVWRGEVGTSAISVGRASSLSNDALRGDFAITSMEGTRVLEATGFVLQRARKESFTDANRDLFELQWIETAPKDSPSASPERPEITWDGRDVGLAQALATHHVLSGDNHQRSLWSPETGRGLSDSLTDALSWVQRLVRQGLRGAVVTEHAQALGPAALHPEASALWGLIRAAREEHPELDLRLVDLDSTHSPDDKMLLLQQALDQPEPEVIVRDRTMFVPRLRPLRGKGENLRIRSYAWYVVTGGHGFIGSRVARWLADQGAQKIALVSRTGPSEVSRDVVADLVRAGVSVRSPCLDLSNKQAVQDALSGLGGEIDGIFHAAGVLDDGVLMDQTAQRLERVLGPKAFGARNLHECSLVHPLSYFVLFSSLTGVLGSRAQIGYAAANAYLDGLAEFRRQKGLPAVSIAWGAWLEGGMAANLSDRQKQRLLGGRFAPIPPLRGIELLQRSLELQRTFVVASPVITKASDADVPPILTSILERKRVKAPAQSLRARLEDALPFERAQLIAEALKSHAASILGLPSPGSVPDAKPLRELGMDSLMAVDLRTRMGTDVDLTLPATLAFDHPTVARQTEFILERLGYTSKEEPPAKTPVAEVDVDVPSLSDLEHTSDDDLLAMIRAETESVSSDEP